MKFRENGNRLFEGITHLKMILKSSRFSITVIYCFIMKCFTFQTVSHLISSIEFVILLGLKKGRLTIL